jgi:hypothetical protein
VAKAGAVVTFEIEQVDPGSGLTVGDTVDVTYSRGTERFLHAGSRYRVETWGEANGTLLGDVAVADRACSGGTWHADGTPIDTGLFTRDGFRPWLLVPLLGGAALVTAIAVAIWRRHRWSRAFYGTSAPPTVEPVSRPGSRPEG